ncbi:MAG: PAS domain-containing protein, partial [Gemmatimonadales bacterium]
MQDDQTAPTIPGYEPQTLLEALPAGVVLTDTEKRCLYVNRRLRQITGLTSDQAAGSGWLQALHHHDRDSILERLETPSSKLRELADELRIRGVDGSFRLVSVRVVPLVDEREELRGYLCAMMGVSERRATDQALR